MKYHADTNIIWTVKSSQISLKNYYHYQGKEKSCVETK